MRAAAVTMVASPLACHEHQDGDATRGSPAMTRIDGPDGLRDQPAALNWMDTSPGWSQAGTKLLLMGIVYQPDGKTPASDVVLYYYQTNAQGRYQHHPDEPRSMPPNELGQTHGSIRGWIKTGPDGRYAIRTIRPGAYPTNDEPAHIHATIKEPDVPEYYIDDFVFDDDPLLTSQRRLRMENRCGSGVLRLVESDGIMVGERDIILGQNIPGHPRSDSGVVASGRKIGEDVVSFTPYHAWGQDRGTRACPICKYGWYHGILYFVGDDPNWTEIRAWLVFLEQESVRRGDRLKVYFVYGAAAGYSRDSRERELGSLGQELDLRHVALTFVPSLTDEESEVVLNRIDPRERSTFILYRRSRIIDKAVGLSPESRNFQWIRDRLDQTSNEYFNATKPGG
ncbi:MAG: intradiol ring-cleavage dioxygenase [Phycisphaerae bacterium]|nr:intradiol ring-cleavage dioxygenase [Phycisphaerae bacterium]